MKYILIISLTILSSSMCIKKRTIIGSWQLKIVSLNNDTIFYREDYSISLKYNYSINKPQSKEDSLACEELALSKFEQSKGLKLIFITDSTFITSKVRSGGRIDSDIDEEGIYNISKDSIYLTVPVRNNYKYILNYDKKNDKLFSFTEHGEMNTYIQYCRIE